jgi:hypothetical protein
MADNIDANQPSRVIQGPVAETGEEFLLYKKMRLVGKSSIFSFFIVYSIMHIDADDYRFIR